MKRKPVFLVMYYNYDDTDYEGVFGTRAAAEQFIERQLASGVDSCSHWRIKEDYQIIEEQVQ